MPRCAHPARCHWGNDCGVRTHHKPCCYSQAYNTTFNLPNLVGGSSQYVVTSTGINNNGPPGVVDIPSLATEVGAVA